MNLFSNFLDIIEESIEDLGADGMLPAGLDLAGVTAEPPRNPEHGDIATNAAMVLARQAGMKPRDLAVPIAERLSAHAYVESAEVAGPGFINIRCRPGVWYDVLAMILPQGSEYGKSGIGGGEKVNIEYVSANPTGPMHVGHGRGAVMGDVLANLLEAVGYDVTREYYINDAGGQIDTLARSVYLRYREALGEDIGSVPEGLYPGAYLIAVGQEIAEEDGDKWQGRPETEWLEHFRHLATDAMMARIQADLEAVGIHHAVFSSERVLHESGAIADAVKYLEDKGLVYTGTLEPPKGKPIEDWEPTPQTLFRATEYGDETDRPLRKSDGSWTYFAADIAYHYDKFRRGYHHMIDIWGADHAGYVKRVQAAVAALTGGEADLDVKLCQLVKLYRHGEPVKMSKRAGQFITLREVVDEVGRDVLRFIMLTRRNDAPLDFDFVKVTEQSRDNPVFYVQYAHARISSVFRNAARDMPGVPCDSDSLQNADFSRLSHADELGLIKQMAIWPRTLDTAARAHEPHRIAFYLYDLAGQFHAYWNKGKEDPGLRFLMADDTTLTQARLALLAGLRSVIASGLGIMGVVPLEEMH